MLNQKDNDFDDLFRRASDKYPLRTDSADWDRMAAALDNPPPDLPDTGQETDRRRRRRFLWFFLLLPLGGVGYYALHQAGLGHGHVVAGTAQSQPSTEASGTAGTEEAGTAGSGSAGTGSAGTRSADAGAVGTGGAGTGVVGAEEAGKETAGAGSAAASGRTGMGSVGSAAGTAVNSRPGAGGAKGGEDTRGYKANATGGDNFARTRNRRDRNAARVMTGSDGNDGSVADGNNAASNGTANGNADGGRVANYPVNRAGISRDYNLTVNVKAPVMHKDSSKTKPKASSKQKSSFLYAGLLAAPDLSTVRFQSTKGMGTTFSLLLGYQFNKKWAIESGVSVDRKRYYTSAEYFKGGPSNPNWKLQSVDGTCYMWEIPINVRYNFSQSEKTKWFATAGLSTYLMTREKYDYQYTQNGWPGTTSKDITTPSQYWFSIINLSAGYEHRLGRIGNLRIEPYLRVPLSGLGTGKLNILSTGLNIGITRRLW